MKKKHWEKNLERTQEWLSTDQEILAGLIARIRATNVSMRESFVSPEVRLEHYRIYEQLCDMWDNLSEIKRKVGRTQFPGD